MASRPIIWVMTSPYMLIYMGMRQGALRIWLYIYHAAPRRFIKDVFSYEDSSLWKKLPPWVNESTSLNDIKHNYRLLNAWIHPNVIVLLHVHLINLFLNSEWWLTNGIYSQYRMENIKWICYHLINLGKARQRGVWIENMFKNRKLVSLTAGYTHPQAMLTVGNKKNEKKIRLYQ